MSDLRSRVVHLARDNAELRPHLLPILAGDKRAAGAPPALVRVIAEWFQNPKDWDIGDNLIDYFPRTVVRILDSGPFVVTSVEATRNGGILVEGRWRMKVSLYSDLGELTVVGTTEYPFGIEMDEGNFEDVFEVARKTGFIE